MDINITLIIQIVNFIIAYVIIRTLLLRPAVTVIMQEEEHLALINKSIDSNNQENKAKEENMARRWTECRQEVDEHAPEIAQAELSLLLIGGPEMPKISELDHRSIEPMADNVAAELVERMSHVR